MSGNCAPSIDLTQITPEVAQFIDQLQEQVKSQAQALEHKNVEIKRKDAEITWRDAKLEKIGFELARLKRWKFGAKTEAMSAQQRALFEDTLVEDEASLQAQLAALQAQLPESAKAPKSPPRKPCRQALPEHLRRVEHRHEPEDTHCPNPDCAQPMQRMGEDVSERLDMVRPSSSCTATFTANGPAAAARRCARSQRNSM